MSYRNVLKNMAHAHALKTVCDSALIPFARRDFEAGASAAIDAILIYLRSNGHPLVTRGESEDWAETIEREFKGEVRDGN